MLTNSIQSRKDIIDTIVGEGQADMEGTDVNFEEVSIIIEHLDCGAFQATMMWDDDSGAELENENLENLIKDINKSLGSIA